MDLRESHHLRSVVDRAWTYAVALSGRREAEVLVRRAWSSAVELGREDDAELVLALVREHARAGRLAEAFYALEFVKTRPYAEQRLSSLPFTGVGFGTSMGTRSSWEGAV
mgnify:CR=1 FL=1